MMFRRSHRSPAEEFSDEQILEMVQLARAQSDRILRNSMTGGVQRVGTDVDGWPVYGHPLL